MLSQPKVIGLDLSAEMIEHCQREHGDCCSNLKFKTFDLAQPDQRDRMVNLLEGKVDLVVCFTVLHWVSNQMEALDFFRKVLKPNGKILMYLLTGHPPSNVCRSTFQAMKEDCPDLLEDIEYR